MDFLEHILIALITVSAAIYGWFKVHRLNSERDRELKRREIITKHLIDAYRLLANDIVHRDPSPETDLKLEMFITDLQLFGSDYQIKLTKKLTDDVVKGGYFSVNELLVDLRNSLREELNLSPIEGRVTWLRYDKKNLPKNN
jgi:hypothetical protein